MLNPFNLDGPSFLVLYVILILSVVGASWWLKLHFKYEVPDEAPTARRDLSPSEIAMLRGGRKELVDAEVAALVHQGTLRIDTESKRVKMGSPPKSSLTELQRSIVNVVQANLEGETVKSIRKATDVSLEPIETSLRSAGLLFSESALYKVRSVPMWLMLGVSLFGGAKILIGLDRNRPVGFLVALFVVSLILAAWLRKRPIHRTQLGDQFLDSLTTEHDSLRAAATTNATGLSSADAMLALCIFGPALFTAGPIADYHRISRPPSDGGSGCGGSGCGSSSGCGGDGGGGGGGGDGGGGCGGCGGGD